jgi:hypothetical protein
VPNVSDVAPLGLYIREGTVHMREGIIVSKLSPGYISAYVYSYEKLLIYDTLIQNAAYVSEIRSYTIKS